MCGIAGCLTRDARFKASVDNCLATLTARGPDCARAFNYARSDYRVALLHTRFSILDLNARSHQPLFNAERSVCIILNGEIYNFQAVRCELEALGYVFRTRSDTEVFLNAY